MQKGRSAAAAAGGKKNAKRNGKGGYSDERAAGEWRWPPGAVFAGVASAAATGASRRVLCRASQVLWRTAGVLRAAAALHVCRAISVPGGRNALSLPPSFGRDRRAPNGGDTHYDGAPPPPHPRAFAVVRATFIATYRQYRFAFAPVVPVLPPADRTPYR